MRKVILCLLLSPCIALSGETRTWSNPDRTKSFQAEFVSRDKTRVTLLKTDGARLTFGIEKLHADDRHWIDLHHPPGEKETAAEDHPPAHTSPADDPAFDTLRFGDTHAVVTEKLKASKVLASNVPGTFFARTGLNGIYHTKHKIGGLHSYLFFDWTERNRLKEITMRTETKKSAEYDSVLKPCWKELIDLIGPIHGKPLQHMGIPSRTELRDGQMLASHLWRIEGGGTVLLGTSRLGEGYQVVIRFTRENIQVRRVP